MRLLVYHDDDVACLNSRHLVSFSKENNLLSMRSALRDFDVEDLDVFDDLLSFALLTLTTWLDDLASAIAGVARASSLRVHAWTKHSHLGSHSSATAILASGHSFSSFAITIHADSFSVDFDLS